MKYIKNANDRCAVNFSLCVFEFDQICAMLLSFQAFIIFKSISKVFFFIIIFAIVFFSCFTSLKKPPKLISFSQGDAFLGYVRWENRKARIKSVALSMVSFCLLLRSYRQPIISCLSGNIQVINTCQSPRGGGGSTTFGE